MKNLECDYFTARKIPTYQRRYMLMRLNDKYEERQEEIANQRTQVKGKKSISGDALKAKFKTKEIPDS